MAEYIKLDAIMEYCQNQKDKTINCNDLARFPTADVIERSEYDKLLEENKQLKRIISDKVNEDLKCAFEIKELRSKIDKAIDEIDFLRQHRAKYITEDNKICIDSGEVLKILKNIGE